MDPNSYELSPLSHVERDQRPERVKRCIIGHDSLFKATWDWFVLALVIYTAIEIPYSASFDLKKSDDNLAVWDRIADAQPVELFNLFVDVMFLVDIIINFRTTFVEKITNNVVYIPKKIAINYLKTWFVIDFLAAMPFEYVISSEKKEAASMAGLLKTARLLRLVRVSRKLDRYSEYGFAVVFLLTSFLCLMAHWMACAWHAIGVQEITNHNSWLFLLGVQTNQSITSIPGSGPTAGSRYVTSLYFVLTSLTSIGFGNVAPNTDTEKIFSIVTMLVGALFYGAIFGNLTAIIQRLYSRSARNSHELRVIKEFTENHEIPASLQKTLNEYITRDQAFPSEEEIKTILPRLPEFLQADIRVHLYSELFTKFHEEFEAVSESGRRALVAKMKTEHLLKGHYLLREGDQVTKLCFIVSGTVHVTQNGMHIGTIDGHGVVGCHPKFANVGIKSKFSLEAQLATDVYHVSCRDVSGLIPSYPDLQDMFLTLLNLNHDLGITDQISQEEPNNDCHTPPNTTEMMSRVHTPLQRPITSFPDGGSQVSAEERLENRIAAIERSVNEILMLLRERCYKPPGGTPQPELSRIFEQQTSV